MPRPSQQCHLPHPWSQSSTCVLTSSTTKETPTLCWWTGFRTGQSCRGTSGLLQSLRDTFSTFGIPETLTSDGGPEFSSHATRTFLKTWGVHHRISSAYHPHAAEVAVKTMKRLIAGNTGQGGTLSDQIHKALLQYRNGPDPTTKVSPATCLFGRATHRASQIVTSPTQNGKTRWTSGRGPYPSETSQVGTNTPKGYRPSSVETLCWSITSLDATPPSGTSGRGTSV